MKKIFIFLIVVDFLLFSSFLLGLIVLLILAATSLHAIYGHRFDVNLEVVPTPDHETIVERTITATDSSVTTETVTTAIINTTISEDDESTPLIIRPKPAIDSGRTLILFE